jgi:uncharacterized protein YndB with AHSA1/START domain
MAEAEAVKAQEITITRVFDAPRELVWKAWTEPDQLAQWWGPPGWSTPPDRIMADPRPGGAFRVTSISDEDGTEMTIVGVYCEVVEPERLVFEEPAEDSWHEGAVSTATFADLGDGRTEMVVHTTINTTDEMRVDAERGMTRTFDRLAEHLAGQEQT